MELEHSERGEVISSIKKIGDCREKVIDYENTCKVEGKPKPERLDFEIDRENEIIKTLTEPLQITNEKGEKIFVQIDTYNTSPLDDRHILVRVEPRPTEDSYTLIFELNDEGKWVLSKEMPVFPALQDPFFEEINGVKTFGGVKTFLRDGEKHYKTVFYKFSNDIREVDPEKPFAEGPEDMKDIRLVQLDNGKIGVFTRPKTNEDDCKIGYFEINKVDDLNADEIKNAQIIAEFLPQQWGGVNDTFRLDDGRIGLIGHIAEYRDVEIKVKENPNDPNSSEKTEIKRKKFYYITCATFNPKIREMSDMRIIAAPDCLPEGIENKKEELGGVLFVGGTVREGNELVIYAGANDTAAVKLRIKWPFKEVKPTEGPALNPNLAPA